jgi:hypothetical protein
MDIEKTEQLRKSWGDKPCLHPALKKVKNTYDKVCTTCGRVVYSSKFPNTYNRSNL